MQGENERFWLDEAQTWTERLKAKRAFWRQFADKPELPVKYSGASPSDRQHVIIGGRNLKRYKNENEIQNGLQPMSIECSSTSRADAR